MKDLIKALSFVGRKSMMNIDIAKVKLPCILKSYISVIESLSVPTVEELCPFILDLVHKTFTNKELENTSTKQLSVEIVDLLQKKISNEVFIKTY